MHVWMTVFTAVLFVVLSPGVFLTLPPGGSKMTVIMVHALVFAVVYSLTHKMVWHYMYPEGFAYKPLPM